MCSLRNLLWMNRTASWIRWAWLAFDWKPKSHCYRRVTSAQNIIKCANRAGLDVCDIVLESLASNEAVLFGRRTQPGGRARGFRRGTTDVAVFSRGTIKYTSVLALGGDNLTYDIFHRMRTPKVRRKDQGQGMAALCPR